MQVIPFLFVTKVVQVKDNILLIYKSQHSNVSPEKSKSRFYVTNCAQPRSLIQWLGDGFPYLHFSLLEKFIQSKLRSSKLEMFALFYPVLLKEKQNKAKQQNNL